MLNLENILREKTESLIANSNFLINEKSEYENNNSKKKYQ